MEAVNRREKPVPAGLSHRPFALAHNTPSAPLTRTPQPSQPSHHGREKKKSASHPVSLRSSLLAVWPETPTTCPLPEQISSEPSLLQRMCDWKGEEYSPCCSIPSVFPHLLPGKPRKGLAQTRCFSITSTQGRTQKKKKRERKKKNSTKQLVQRRIPGCGSPKSRGSGASRTPAEDPGLQLQSSERKERERSHQCGTMCGNLESFPQFCVG
ncbi:uncharacterized protein B0H64DRAFT_9603 [Chaetomium fimeti]|uniref:Uncharacterized protein n=1 Tax=Chaetomium fimeti TaxID=1854472 RepID=A0AAE0HPD7_9PEZI|nr:hypothetical protein B0H64DRAFT_9603 [Chaetomium fimeti]